MDETTELKHQNKMTTESIQPVLKSSQRQNELPKTYTRVNSCYEKIPQSQNRQCLSDHRVKTRCRKVATESEPVKTKYHRVRTNYVQVIRVKTGYPNLNTESTQAMTRTTE